MNLDAARLRERVLGASAPGADPGEAVVLADYALERGDLPLAASALDRAFGLRPDDAGIADIRRQVLDQLAVVEHGLVFRYVPAGTFLLGATDGDPDERPVHPVRLAAYHVAEIPTTWTAYCRLLGWSAPPEGEPPADPGGPREGFDRAGFHLYESNKIRHQYCGSDGDDVREVRGVRVRVPPPGEDTPGWAYDRKPMVAVAAEDGEVLAAHLSTAEVVYALPTEAQWEKAARGGRIGARYPWGDAPPTPDRCDFGHFGAFHVLDPRTLPANDYGLYGMCGGVWEWTADRYWALAYRREGAPPADLPERALRGGSWADCARAVRVSQRMSRQSASWRDGQWSGANTPNVGFRLVRTSLNP